MSALFRAGGDGDMTYEEATTYARGKGWTWAIWKGYAQVWENGERIASCRGKGSDESVIADLISTIRLSLECHAWEAVGKC